VAPIDDRLGTYWGYVYGAIGNRRDAQISLRTIAESVGFSVATVQNVLKRAAKAEAAE
jgi:hypothetical protein